MVYNRTFTRAPSAKSNAAWDAMFPSMGQNLSFIKLILHALIQDRVLIAVNRRRRFRQTPFDCTQTFRPRCLS